ncbi:tRNA1(Val) (adenine(37)-N6)-methyltransferase [Pseudooceanicola sediminis]|nr:methyltransferase [Pseudooceanicola sediminis]|tara:strand:- start:21422 stop:22177 length:756 start_codon:yes stop_codon:yes gene_type:complete
MDEDLSRDRFLGGRLTLLQPRRGYRAGVDPVFLAASVQAQAGQSLLDLGCGGGVAALCAGARIPGMSLAGLERQAPYAELARRNAADNDLQMRVFEGDLATMPPDLRQLRFDHVIANPPFFRRDASVPAQAQDREGALGEDTPLDVWVAAAARRCLPGGYVTFVHRSERLPELLAAFSQCLGSIELKPLLPRAGRAAHLVLLRGRKGGRAAFRLHAGMVLHQGESHGADGADYTPEVSRILRDADPLIFAR